MPILALSGVFCFACAAAGDLQAQIHSALELAGSNRPEIEGALRHYEAEGDPQKLEAVRFLVANLPGHGSIDYALFDGQGQAMPFSALDYANFGAAQAALDGLELEHGAVDFEKLPLIEDLGVLTTAQIVENLDLAFEAWRGFPWARSMEFETFLEHVLPHRGSNEPAEDWRGPLMKQLPELIAGLGTAPSAAQVAERMSRYAAQQVGFTELYYLHPTDQGYAEMTVQHRGRCEDITNFTTYCLRAACIASAADYTPWWGHSDNNHAWPVILDEHGRGRAPDGNRAAKVYRKTYRIQRQNLCFQLAEGESAPPWLDRDTYIDVTDQYFQTVDLKFALEAPQGQRFGYLCVFNGGEWRPIHWGRIEGQRLALDRMNTGLLYLPALWVDGAVQPLSAPLWLQPDGSSQVLSGHAASQVHVELSGPADRASELLVWDGGWKSVARLEAGQRSAFDLPSDGLFWLLGEHSRRLERPFCLVDGAVRQL